MTTFKIASQPHLKGIEECRIEGGQGNFFLYAVVIIWISEKISQIQQFKKWLVMLFKTWITYILIALEYTWVFYFYFLCVFYFQLYLFFSFISFWLFSFISCHSSDFHNLVFSALNYFACIGYTKIWTIIISNVLIRACDCKFWNDLTEYVTSVTSTNWYQRLV